MSEGEIEYDEAVTVSNLYAHVDLLTDQSLRHLHAHASWLLKQNGKPGGIPQIVLGVCDLSAAKRFLQKQ